MTGAGRWVHEQEIGARNAIRTGAFDDDERVVRDIAPERSELGAEQLDPRIARESACNPGARRFGAQHDRQVLTRWDANVRAVVGAERITRRKVNDETHALVGRRRVEREHDGGFFPRRQLQTAGREGRDRAPRKERHEGRTPVFSEIFDESEDLHAIAPGRLTRPGHVRAYDPDVVRLRSDAHDIGGKRRHREGVAVRQSAVGDDDDAARTRMRPQVIGCQTERASKVSFDLAEFHPVDGCVDALLVALERRHDARLPAGLDDQSVGSGPEPPGDRACGLASELEPGAPVARDGSHRRARIDDDRDVGRIDLPAANGGARERECERGDG